MFFQIFLADFLLWKTRFFKNLSIEDSLHSSPLFPPFISFLRLRLQLFFIVEAFSPVITDSSFIVGGGLHLSPFARQKFFTLRTRETLFLPSPLQIWAAELSSLIVNPSSPLRLRNPLLRSIQSRSVIYFLFSSLLC